MSIDPERAVSLSPDQFDEALATGTRLAEAEAASMLSRGVSPDIASRHIRFAVEREAATRAAILSRLQPVAKPPAEPVPEPPAQPGGSTALPPATANPPPDRPPSPEPRTVSERFLANAQQIRQERQERQQTTGASMDMSRPAWLKPGPR